MNENYSKICWVIKYIYIYLHTHICLSKYKKDVCVYVCVYVSVVEEVVCVHICFWLILSYFHWPHGF